MSSLSTLPKGDSAWLLRKSIQRVMQQISVLETNIGSSTTGNSANNQVIFNDNGTLRGDGGLTYSSATDALTAGSFNPTASAIPTNGIYLPSSKNIGIAVDGVNVLNIDGIASRVTTTGSATITGDLTVRTNKLAVTSNGVGIGTATPAAGFALDIQTAGVTNARIKGGSGSGQGAAYYVTLAASTSTLMAIGDRAAIFGGTPDTTASIYTGSGIPLTFDVGASTAMTLNSTGLGVGVTPSAWGSNSKLVQVGGGSAAVSSTGAGSTASRFTHGCYFDNTDWKYQNNSVGPALYEVTGSNAGSTHAWYVAPGGTAGNTVTDFATAKMTLDASGNLLVGKTALDYTTVGFQAENTGNFTLTRSGTTNATGTLNVYSTGAGAYRFYVAMDGTVYATNTTISAISDARFKENVQDIDVGLDAILALKPRKFDWKAGKGKDIKGDRGFIAQEFEQVFPQLVDEWKDNAPEGEAPYKSVRQDLIPVLVKAIQELTARVQTLEAR